MTISIIDYRSELPIIERARIFATAAHAAVGQVRKYTGDPYIRHPVAVAAKLREHGVTDPDMLCAALLHDTVEDTEITQQLIELTFGRCVGRYVGELSDVSKPSDGNRSVRKRIDCEHTAQASPQAKSIKLADLIDNTITIATYDPRFARTYMIEKGLLLGVLRDASVPSLWTEANNIVEAYYY